MSIITISKYWGGENHGNVKVPVLSRKFNCLRSWRQPKKVIKMRSVGLPASVDLRNEDSPIFDQGTEGSCTANAWCGLADFLEIKYGLTSSQYKNREEYVKGEFVPASRAFVYWVERAFDGDPDQDQGSYLHTGGQVFSTKGACSEDDYPYGPSTLYGKPSSALFGLAWHHKMNSVSQINDGDISTIKARLAQGFPVVFGCTLYQSFQNIGSSGIVTYPNVWYEMPIGGHALCIVGYDDTKEVFIVRNSWGTSWGDNGYCYFPYQYISNTQLASDIWTGE